MIIGNRAWTLGALLLVVVIIAATWFIGVSPVLSQAGASSSEKENVVAQNAVQEARLVSLKGRFEAIDSLRADLDGQQKLIPAGTQIPRFLGQLDRITSASGVTITEVTVADGVPYEPAVPEETPADEAVATDGAVTGETAAAEGGGKAAEVTTDLPASLVDGSNFVAIPISISTAGSFDQVMDFVSGVQSGERLFLVTALTISETSDKAGFTGDVSGFIYVLLDEADVEEEPSDETAAEASTATVN